MKQVTEIRCSGLARPMQCAGYLRFENLPPQPTNPAAEEGTAAGELLALKLLKKPIGPAATNGVGFNSEMDFYTTPIVQEIMTPELQIPVTCEQRIDWQTRSGIWIKGSYDISYMVNDFLYIDDLKYGWGIVDVFENWQLLGYAIGRYLQLGQPMLKGVILRIHQPRPHHEEGPTRSWVLTIDELMMYKEIIEARMIEIDGGRADLVTGKQCKHCPAATRCPAFNETYYNVIDVVHEDFNQMNLTEKEIAFQMTQILRAKDILKIKEDSLKELAIDRIRNGTLIPGYSVESSYGDRKWKPNISPDVIKALTGKDIVAAPEMLSPAKAEKLGVPKDLVNKFVDRPYLGQKLVPKDAKIEADKIFGGAPVVKN